MYKNYDSVIHLREKPAYKYLRQYRTYEEAKKATRFSVKCAVNSHPIFGVLAKSNSTDGSNT
jgi:hypothetical protein